MREQVTAGYMKRVLTLAARGAGSAHPNPMVGAVVVADGKIVGEGWHRRPGEPHAEILALAEAGSASSGGTLYVNLEPCDHSGRTPPCTRAIIAAGIKQVVAACRDPHRLVDGRGFETLRKAGIVVTTGTMESQAEELNRAFFHFSRKGAPYVTLKLASTLDGRIAAPDGSSRWISGEKARNFVHRLRNQVDAVLVGVGTVMSDDPALTARVGSPRKQPYRVIMDPGLKTPPDAAVISDNAAGTTLLVVGEDVPPDRCGIFENMGVELIKLPLTNGFLSWNDLCGPLLERGILHVLVEGGGATAARMLRQDAVNRLELFLAPKILGAAGAPVVGDMELSTLADAAELKYRRIRKIGDDLHITVDLK